MDAAELEGKRVTVMGLGRFGGGASVTRWLAGRGASVLLTDIEPEEKLAASVAQISDLVKSGSVELRLGGHNVSDFTTCDMVVANPAVPRPWENRFLRAAWASGIPVTTEIDLAIAQLPDRARIIGVTGSAGKSTTSAMIHHILRENGFSAVFGGNIGGSLLASRIDPGAHVVLELSSAMLCWLGGLAKVPPAELGRESAGTGWSPHVAVVTNLSPNHLDWHGDLAHYRRSKQEILRSQSAGDIAVFAASSGNEASEWETAPGVERVRAQGELNGLAIPGKHNRQNAALAIEAVLAAEPRLTRELAERGVRTFGGLPHRLQLAATVSREGGSIRCFNDSKSTTPDACLLAVEAFEEPGEAGAERVHLIAGGYDKGSDLSVIGDLASKLAGLYTIGKTGPSISASAGGRAKECATVERAVSEAMKAARGGDVILLSPACASWDQFENYEKRGELFVREVNRFGEAQ